MTLVDTRTPNPKNFIKGSTGDWEIVIGMEVHAQVLSESKLFSGSSTDFGSPPNANVSFVDAAMPGMLPVINDQCVKQAVRTGLGLKAQINKRSVHRAMEIMGIRTGLRAGSELQALASQLPSTRAVLAGGNPIASVKNASRSES